MTSKTPKPHLAYILETLGAIHEFTPKQLDAFMNDRNAQDATLMRLQDIGEQLAHIRDQFPDFYYREQHASWNKLIGLRNIISHGYREIDFDVIWDIVTNKLGDFETHLQTLLDRL